MALINNFPITINNSGSSLPSGGTIGQALVKRSATDGDVEWGNIIPASEKGTASGVAELDSNGKVLSSQLPSYVDDVIEGYYNSTDDRFYEESTFTTLITPESGKSWVDITSNKSYRWSGSVYIRVDEGVQLGETSSSAYRGDRGKTAYDFSQTPYTNTPSMDNGTGSAGSSNTWSRGDHVHPSDTTKVDKVSGATSGHLAALDSSGNLTDSGKALSDLQAKLTAGNGITINSSTNTISADVNGAYDIYDSTERVVGTWFGEPLYQKTIDLGALPNATTKNVAHGISNLSRVVKGEGIAYSSANQVPLPWVSVSNIIQNVNIYFDATKIYISTGADKSSYNAYFTIQYTKTT